MNCEHLEQQLAELPLYGYFFLKTGELTFTDRVRWICQHECQMYGKTWACPPAVGTVEECLDNFQVIAAQFPFSVLQLLSALKGTAVHVIFLSRSFWQLPIQDLMHVCYISKEDFFLRKEDIIRFAEKLGISPYGKAGDTYSEGNRRLGGGCFAVSAKWLRGGGMGKAEPPDGGFILEKAGGYP